MFASYILVIRCLSNALSPLPFEHVVHFLGLAVRNVGSLVYSESLVLVLMILYFEYLSSLLRMAVSHSDLYFIASA